MTLQLSRACVFPLYVVGAALTFLSAPRAASAQQPGVAGQPVNAPLPFDPAVTVGVLPNGMRYYIRENHKPEKRAELRLVVNAGSVLEDEDQRGLA
ncbi:MAG: zinc protease, partial [Gemmatimonadaceae bacterium]|nr:zinc protease [Gemmatimonadaceae bacterium]